MSFVQESHKKEEEPFQKPYLTAKTSDGSKSKDSFTQSSEPTIVLVQSPAHRTTNIREVIIDTNTEATATTTQALLDKEMTDEGLALEKKLDIMSKNLRGNNKSFSFGTKTGSSKHQQSSFKPPSISQKVESNGPESSFPNFGLKKKEIVFEPYVTNDLQEEQQIKENNSSQTLHHRSGPKKDLFTIDSSDSTQTKEKSSIKNSDSEADPETIIHDNQPKLILNEPLEALILPIKKEAKAGFKSKKLTMGGLGLDIDSINANFTFGGEQGQKVATNTEQEVDEFAKGIADLAKMCVQYMSKENYYCIFSFP